MSDADHTPHVYDPRDHADMLARDPMAYAAMVQSVSAFGIYLIDPRGHIISWNTGAERLTQIGSEAIIGQPYAALFTGAERDQRVPDQVLGHAKYKKHISDEQNRRRANGKTFRAKFTLDLVLDGNGEHAGFVEVIHDVTRARERERDLVKLATRDSLTGLANRGYFTEQANIELQRAERYNDPVSVVMVDIDHFKKVNDTYGHDVGDLALRHVSDTLLRSVRKIDIVGRLGGEEFALILPRAALQPATEMCERMRQAVSGKQVPHPSTPFKVTASMGVASRSADREDLDQLLKYADNALYRAKRGGRDRVEQWLE